MMKVVLPKFKLDIIFMLSYPSRPWPPTPRIANTLSLSQPRNTGNLLHPLSISRGEG